MSDNPVKKITDNPVGAAVGGAMGFGSGALATVGGAAIGAATGLGKKLGKRPAGPNLTGVEEAPNPQNSQEAMDAASAGQRLRARGMLSNMLSGGGRSGTRFSAGVPELKTARRTLMGS